MIEIGIVGAKNSGKTTLIEKLVPELSARGMRIATIKHTDHDHGFDTESKDSHRHRAAGAGLTLAMSRSELALFAPQEPAYMKAVNGLIANCFDICLVEGDKRASRAKLFLTRLQGSPADVMPTNIVASFGADRLEPNLPHFQSDDIGSLVDFLIERHSAIEMKGKTRG